MIDDPLREKAKALLVSRQKNLKKNMEKQVSSRVSEQLEMYCSEALERAIEQIQEWGKEGIHIVERGAELYPSQLEQVAVPPEVIFCKGELNPSKLSAPCFAVVGSRQADPQACRVAQNLSRELVHAGACVVSGLALGIDGAAHTGALEAKNSKFPTIAVLGQGLSQVYPAQHRRLAECILDKGGVLVSQFEPDVKPYPSNFLERNHVISGLALGVLIVQAAQRSGALVTARAALEQGREVFAVPGSILDPRNAGSNQLLKEGAHLVTVVEDIIEHFDQLRNMQSVVKPTDDREDTEPSNSLSRGILMHLKRVEKVLVSDLALKLDQNPYLIEPILLELEIRELIERLPGNFVRISI